MRLVLPLLLIAPMPLLSLAATAWQHLLHGTETRAIADQAGRLQVGGSTRWSAVSLFPWSGRSGGLVAVTAQEGAGEVICRDVTNSFCKDASSFFRITPCSTDTRGPWMLARDGTNRWGG